MIDSYNYYIIITSLLYVIVKRIVCNEEFEKALTEHLQSQEWKLVEITEECMDDAFSGAKYDYSETEVEWGDIHELNTFSEHIGEPIKYVNRDDKPSEEQYQKEIEYTEGLELSKTNSSGWSICGGLSAAYKGTGTSVNVGYTRNQSETVTKTKGKKVRETITKTLVVPSQHSREIVVKQQYQRKECKVKNVKLIFSKNAKIKCKVHDNRKLSKPKRKKRYQPYIKDVLKKHIEDDNTNPLIARMDGKYVWVETGIIVDVSTAKPISKLDNN